MSQPLISARNVSKRYAGATADVLKSVDFNVMRGEYISIMGKSGSGKSTLLHILAGLDTPSSGEVYVTTDKLSHMKENDLALFRRSRVGFVHQFFNLIDNMTVLENVVIPALLMGVKYRHARQRALQLFEELELNGMERKLPGTLSGGQKQRVAIVRALINQPALLLADEPTGSLDSHTGEAVMRTFHDLHAKGYTIVMVTHDPKVASQADRILFMQDGLLTDETVMSDVQTSNYLVSKVLGVL